MKNFKAVEIINHLWNWITTNKDRELVKDTTSVYSVKYDGYINSTIADPLSFSAFELSDKGDLIVDDVTRLMESEAAFFIFVNTKAGWIVAVKNNAENVKKLVKGEPVQRMKVRIVP